MICSFVQGMARSPPAISLLSDVAPPLSASRCLAVSARANHHSTGRRGATPTVSPTPPKQRGGSCMGELEPPLPREQILQQRLVEADAGVDGDIIDVGASAVGLVALAKVLDRFQVVAAHPFGIERQLALLLHVAELDDPLE